MSSPAPLPIPMQDPRQNGKKLGISETAAPALDPGLTSFDPSPWLSAVRTTPGMTNRVNDDRFPANPFPGNHESTPRETAAADFTKPEPIAVSNASWMRNAAYLIVAIGVVIAVAGSKKNFLS